MQLCLGCLDSVPEDGLVMLLEGLEMGEFAVLMVLNLDYLDVRMVLEEVSCLCL